MELMPGPVDGLFYIAREWSVPRNHIPECFEYYGEDPAYMRLVRSGIPDHWLELDTSCTRERWEYYEMERQ